MHLLGYVSVVLQELSKITMPVIFNEPLSFLQRVVEYMEYGGLLERASACDDPIERHEVSWHRLVFFTLLCTNTIECSLIFYGPDALPDAQPPLL